MAITKEFIGWNADGTPNISYVSDGHVVLTGPIKGSITTADGTEYDVSPEVVEVDPAHADEVAQLVGEWYVANGHPQHDENTPFILAQEG